MLVNTSSRPPKVKFMSPRVPDARLDRLKTTVINGNVETLLSSYVLDF